MGEQFAAGFTGVLPGTPDQVWTAITENSAAWLWPVSYEPRIGGAETGLGGSVITAWEPGRHLATHSERSDGWFNTLTYTFTPADGGTHLSYVHQGVHENDYATEQAACVAHTDLYFHSLGQYLGHFPGRTAAYATADAPESATFAGVLSALGIADAAVGDRVRFDAPELVDGVVDYRTAVMLGIRTDNALYRFYGRDIWGWPLGVGHHLFADGADGDAASAVWEKWLATVVA